MHFCACPITLLSALESGHEAKIAHIYFSAAFDRVKHQEFSMSVDVGGSALTILTQLLSN